MPKNAVLSKRSSFQQTNEKILLLGKQDQNKIKIEFAYVNLYACIFLSGGVIIVAGGIITIILKIKKAVKACLLNR